MPSPGLTALGRVGMCGGQLQDDAVASRLHDGAQPHPAALGKSPFHQPLMVHALQKAGRKAAGKALLQSSDCLPRQSETVPPAGPRPIAARYVCEATATYCGLLNRPSILKLLTPSFDQRLDQIVGRLNPAGSANRLSRRGRAVTIDDQFIRKPAGLGALAPIGARPPSASLVRHWPL